MVVLLSPGVIRLQDETEFPDYRSVISNPIDLGTIQDKLERGSYQTPEDLAADVRLMFNNCLK